MGRGSGDPGDSLALKQAQEAVRQSEERFRRLFDTMQEGFFLAEVVCDEAGKPIDLRYLETNPAFDGLTGLNHADIIGRTVREVLPEVEDYWIDTFGRVALTREPARLERFALPLGRYYRTVAYSPRPGQAAVIFSDVTDRHNAEAERERLLADLSQQTHLLDAVVESTLTHLVYLDRDFNYIWVNNTYAQSRGYDPDRMVGLNHFDLYPDPENEAIFRQVRDSGQSAEFREKPLEFADHPERGVTYWDWTLTPIERDAGDVEGLVFALSDVTEKVVTRERLLSAERARADIAAELTAEINHRMKNNLALLSGVLEMQARGLPPDSPAEEAVRNAITRLSALAVVHEHLSEGQSGRVELRDVLQRVATMAVQGLAKGSVALSVTGDEVLASPKLGSTLAIVANELITNAIKYGRPGDRGEPEITVRTTRNESGVHIAVWNSGDPVPPGFLDGQHTGLGLPLVVSLVREQMEGDISVEASGHGTLVQLTIDLSRAEGEDPNASTGDPS